MIKEQRARTEYYSLNAHDQNFFVLCSFRLCSILLLFLDKFSVSFYPHDVTDHGFQESRSYIKV